MGPACRAGQVLSENCKPIIEILYSLKKKLLIKITKKIHNFRKKRKTQKF